MPSRERGPKDHGYYILRNLVPWPTRAKSRAPARASNTLPLCQQPNVLAAMATRTKERTSNTGRLLNVYGCAVSYPSLWQTGCGRSGVGPGRRRSSRRLTGRAAPAIPAQGLSSCLHWAPAAAVAWPGRLGGGGYRLAGQLIEGGGQVRAARRGQSGRTCESDTAAELWKLR